MLQFSRESICFSANFAEIIKVSRALHESYPVRRIRYEYAHAYVCVQMCRQLDCSFADPRPAYGVDL